MNTRLVAFLALFAACLASTASSLDDTAPSNDLSNEIQTSILYRPDKCDIVVTDGNTVEIHFTGMNYATEKQFDSSRDSKPVRFTVGEHLTLPAWELGVPGMCVGEIRRLVSPAEYAYRSEGIHGFVAPDETVIFDVELIKIVSPLAWMINPITAVVGLAIVLAVFYVIGLPGTRITAQKGKNGLGEDAGGSAMVEEIEVSGSEDNS